VENLEVTAYAAIAIAIFSLILAGLALNSAQKSRKQLVIFRGSADELDILDSTVNISNRLNDINGQLNQVAMQLVEAQQDLQVSLRHTAVVRYNAFQEAGGQFSFSIALLDDNDSGLVISGIQGASSGRVYAKSITNGESDNPLTPEEKQAILNASARRLS
jgi:hypothetical protein